MHQATESIVSREINHDYIKLCLVLSQLLRLNKRRGDKSSAVSSKRLNGINTAAKRASYMQSEDNVSQKRVGTIWQSHVKSYKDRTQHVFLQNDSL